MKKLLLLVLSLALLIACGAKSPEEAREIINSNFENARDKVNNVIENSATGTANGVEEGENTSEDDTEAAE